MPVGPHSYSTWAAVTSRTGGRTCSSIDTGRRAWRPAFRPGRRPSPRPLFDADAADMPFADQVFDYVICSHLLEHVTDPGAVIDEMVRVARAGYIEVPPSPAPRSPTSPATCGGAIWSTGLIFTAKDRSQFDPDIERFVGEPEVRRDVFVRRNFDACIVRLRWTGSVRYVDGSVRPNSWPTVRRCRSCGEHHQPHPHRRPEPAEAIPPPSTADVQRGSSSQSCVSMAATGPVEAGVGGRAFPLTTQDASGESPPAAIRPRARHRRALPLGRHACLQRAGDDRRGHASSSRFAVRRRSDRRRRRLDRCHRGSEFGASTIPVAARAAAVQHGQGQRCEEGIAEASADFVIIQDADLEADPDDYGRVLRPLIEGQADVVYEVATAEGGGAKFAAMAHDRQPAADHGVERERDRSRSPTWSYYKALGEVSWWIENRGGPFGFACRSAADRPRPLAALRGSGVVRRTHLRGGEDRMA